MVGSAATRTVAGMSDTTPMMREGASGGGPVGGGSLGRPRDQFSNLPMAARGSEKPSARAAVWLMTTVGWAKVFGSVRTASSP